MKKTQKNIIKVVVILMAIVGIALFARVRALEEEKSLGCTVCGTNEFTENDEGNFECINCGTEDIEEELCVEVVDHSELDEECEGNLGEVPEISCDELTTEELSSLDE